MQLSLKEYFISLSSLLDFLEVEMHSRPTNHCKRVALFALKLGSEMGLDEDERFSLGALALLHDLGASMAVLIQKMEKQKNPDIEVFPDHCKAGADLVSGIPFLSGQSDVILYHHERYDGKGYYGADTVPLFSSIITISDRVDMELFNKSSGMDAPNKLLEKEKGRIFSPEIAEAGLLSLSSCNMFQTLDDANVLSGINAELPEKMISASGEEILEMTQPFSNIVDAKSPFTRNHSSQLTDKVAAMCEYYKFDREKTIKMLIAANLHDIGKLAVPNRILEKNGKLTPEEFDVIKTHTYYTRIALQQISGWEDITDWASDHHEKLNGKGYPIGKSADELSFEARFMACLDIYQALSEDRPYKQGFSNEKSFGILDECVARNEIDGSIVEDMKKVFV